MVLVTQTSESAQAMIEVAHKAFSGPSRSAPEYYKDHLEISILNAKGNKGLFENERWMVGSCCFEKRTMDAAVFRKDARHCLGSKGGLQIVRYTSGGVVGQINDQPVSSPVGVISISDWGHPIEGVQRAGICQSIFVPREAIGFSFDAPVSHAQYDDQSKSGRLLHAQIDYFYDQLLNGARAIPLRRLEKFVSAIRQLLSGTELVRDVRSDARDLLGIEIKEFIEGNLKSPTLTPDSLLTEYGVSRASLYRIFEMDGGVRKYIYDRRLYNAVRTLSQTVLVRGDMSRIAEDWGFSSYVLFNRAVRREYGVPPKSLFRAASDSRATPKARRGCALA